MNRTHKKPSWERSHINPPLVVEYVPTSPSRSSAKNILGDALICGDAPRRFQFILAARAGEAGGAARAGGAGGRVGGRAKRAERASERADGRTPVRLSDILNSQNYKI